MSKPFIVRLEKYLRGIVDAMHGEKVSSSIFPNPTDAGESREKIFKEFLRLHAPLSSDVFLGGFLFGQDGSESKQIDIIVTDDSSLKFDFFNKAGDGKAFACIDGAAGAFTIKSFLSKNELFDALDNLASIPQGTSLDGKNSSPNINLCGLSDGLLKVVVAFDGIESASIIKHIAEYYTRNNCVPLNRRPNYIYVLGKYCWIKVREAMPNDDGVLVLPGAFCLRRRESDIFFLSEVLLTLEKLVRLQRQVFYDYTPVFSLLTPP